MPSQQIPAAPVVGGVVSRRHAKLLQHLLDGNNNNGGGAVSAPVKDLRLRRVVPPASAPPPDASPDPPAAAAKPLPAVVQIQVQSTPPEPCAAAAADDRERKPILMPRSKLVRDPASFGYRRLLPFLNQMATKKGSDIPDAKDAPSETRVPVSAIKELARSDSGLADEPVDGSQSGAAPVGSVDSVEPLAAKDSGDREVKDCSDTVKEEAKVSVSADPASTKPCVARCARSKFVHHPSSFSYKRMLPFLMENEISSQEQDRAKIRRLSEDESDVLASGDSLLAMPKGSPEERSRAEVGRAVEEATPILAEVQNVTQEQVLASAGDPLSSGKGELASDRNAVPVSWQCPPAVSEGSPEERDAAGAETAVEEREASKSDGKSVLMEDSMEPLVVKAGGEETKAVPGDLASSKPCLKRITRSRFVPHPSSFSYKRMLPFLTGNEISSQEGDTAKFQRVVEEKQLASDESDVMSTGDHHLSTPKDSAEAGYMAELERIVEEIATSPYENYLLKDGQLQSAVAQVSLDGSIAEVQKASPEAVLSSDKDELASDGDGVLAGAKCELAVSEDLHKQSNLAEAERVVVEEKATKSDEKSVLDGTNLQSAVSEEPPQEGDAEKELTQKLAEDEASRTTQLCQSSESGCSGVGFGSPTNTVMVDGEADQHGSLERHDSVASPDALLLDVICRPSDPCASDAPLSAEKKISCLKQAESGLRKVDTLRSCGSPTLEKQSLSLKKLFPVNGALGSVSCLKKRVLSPKKLSPKKGILKRHTMGCRGICMCLDCSVFRLRADRAFEFSRKQMHEADDIIGNLLEEVVSLRSLAEKSSGQQEQIEEACERASRVEEVARERRQQMQVELNAHCKIPGPRVKFAQYVEEKMTLTPRGSSRRPPL